MLLKSKARYFSLPVRIGYLGAGMLIFVIAYSVGAALSLSEQEAADIRKSFLEDNQNIDQAGIFLNNIRVGLSMFVPGVGVGVGVYSGVSTGMVFHAFALTSEAVAKMQPLSVLVSPFGILELLAYGLAISRSGMLVAQLISKDERTKNWKRFSIYTGIEIGIVLAALIAGSVIESSSASM